MNSVPISIWEWLAKLDSRGRTDVVVLGLLAVAFIASILLFTIYQIHKNRLEDALKRELLERGMSADEIATVIRARPTKKCATTMNSKLGGTSI